MPTPSIPNEILEYIFQIKVLKQCDVYNCALVCRSWSLPASRVLHEKIVVDGNFRETLRCLANSGNNLGKSCKVLLFLRSSFPSRFEDFEKLLNYLPNIKRIGLTVHNNKACILKLLNKHANLLKNVQEVFTINSNWIGDEKQKYCDLSITLRKTIQTLNLPFTESATFETYKGADLPSFLSNFQLLRILHISGLRNFRVLPILRSCPHLLKFSLVNVGLDTEDDDNDGFACSSDLEYLEIKGVVLSQKQMDYIISHVTRLKQIKLSMGKRTTHQTLPMDWINQIGFDCLNRLQDYLAGIDLVDFVVDVNSKPSIIKYWPLIKRVIDANPQILPLNFSVRYASNHPKVCLKKRRDDIYVSYVLEEVRGYLPIYPTIHTIMPFDCPKSQIQSIVINIEARTAALTSYLDLLESILHGIPNLHYFHAKINQFQETPYRTEVGLTKRKYKHNNPEFFYSNMDTQHRFSMLTNELGHVCFKKIEWSWEAKLFLEKLPQIKYLELYDIQLRRDRDSNMILNLGNVSLKFLVLDISGLLDHLHSSQTVTVHSKNQRIVMHIKRNTHGTPFSFIEQKEGHRAPTIGTHLIIQCHEIEEIDVRLGESSFKATSNSSLHND